MSKDGSFILAAPFFIAFDHPIHELHAVCVCTGLLILLLLLVVLPILLRRGHCSKMKEREKERKKEDG